MIAPLSQSKSLDTKTGRSLFDIDAAGYHAGRIGYPAELYELLFARTARSPHTLEIGAGTGLVTEVLLARDISELVVVEPGADLVKFILDRLRDPRLSCMIGAFPEVSPESKFDLIICAAAFHWMEPQAALSHVRELLNPGGIWSMWWNSYRNFGVGDPLADAITPLLRGIALPPSDSLEMHYSLDVEGHSSRLLAAGFCEIEHRLFRTERILTTDHVRALYASYSYIRALPENQRLALLDNICSIVDTQFNGYAPNVVLTSYYSAASR